MPTLRRLAPWLLVLAVVAVYGASAAGGFLNHDDDVLVSENPMVGRPGIEALRAMWFDLSMETRLSFGAEYLPIRDLSVWAQIQLFGKNPVGMRIVNLALYVAAVLAFRVFFLRGVEGGAGGELAAWVFALHPIHAESVAWISGHKDVLAMGWVGAALALYAGDRRARTWLVPLCLLMAHLSKSMTIIAPALLVTVDLLRRRRPDLRILGAAVVVAAGAFVLHWKVGQTVGMVQPPLGGSRMHAAMTMGGVWLRYLHQLLWPNALSVVHDVPVSETWTAASALGWLVVFSGLGVALALWAKGRPRGLVLWIWLFMPLLPVSQVLVSLQNVMADRYAFLSVAGLSLGVAWICALGRAVPFVVGALTAGLAAEAVARANVFSNSIALFADAAIKAPRHALPPFQMGMAYETAGALVRAEGAYLEAIARGRPPDPACRAVNNVARLYFRGGDLPSAERALRRGARICPGNEKVARNLERVLDAQRKRQRPER